MVAAVLARVAAASTSDAPWLLPYRAAAQRLALQLAPGVMLAQALNAVLADGPPIVLDAGALRFVAASALPVGEPYEAFVARSACVPTRDDPHDLFNALVWLVHPGLKAHLNRLHVAVLARDGVTATRGALRDALTLFDENGALLHAPATLARALRERDWHALFGALRLQWAQAELVLVGHALLDKLMQPRKAITAHVWIADAARDACDIDALPRALTPQRLATRPFVPLPVLGVPGWWPANQDSGFYADAQVFRPSRR